MQAAVGVVFAEVDGQIVARCAAGSDRPALDAAGLRGLLDGAGYGDWALSDAALAGLLTRYLNEPAGFELTVGRRLDAQATIELAPDAMQAWVEVTRARGGRPMTPEALRQLLAERGVTHGIDFAALETACTSPQRVAVATGTPPSHGEDSSFELLVAEMRERRPKVDAQGRVDFHELGDFPMVAAGQPLMRRRPASAGTDGRDVCGIVLPARQGKDEAFDKGLAGAAVSPDDANLLCATCAGLPVDTGHGVRVEQVLKLADVDLKCGNVRFDGSIEIGGDVHPGMLVEASGDVAVKGSVESARIKAGGNVQVGGGVLANAVVVSGRSVKARFVEHSSVQAETTIDIGDMAVHSELQALEEVRVGVSAGPRGRLVGGSTSALLRVQAPQLGAPAGGLTKVQVGVNPALNARYHDLLATVATLRSDKEKLEKIVTYLSTHGDPKGLLERARATWKAALDAWHESLQRKDEVEAGLALSASAVIEVTSGVVGDVEVAFGAVRAQTRGGLGAGVFALDDEGQIGFRSSSGALLALL